MHVKAYFHLFFTAGTHNTAIGRLVTHRQNTTCSVGGNILPGFLMFYTTSCVSVNFP